MSTAVAERKRRLINASDAARYFIQFHGIRVAPGTIRQWAARNQIGTHSITRRERYDLVEIEERARELGLIAQ